MAKQDLRWSRFSLRTLLILMLVFGAAVVCIRFLWQSGNKLRAAAKQRQATEQIRASCGWAVCRIYSDASQSGPSYDTSRSYGTNLRTKVIAIGFGGMRSDRLPVDFEGRRRAAAHRNPPTNQVLTWLQHLPHLKALDLSGTDLTDKSIQRIRHLTLLEELTLGVTFDNPGLRNRHRYSPT